MGEGGSAMAHLPGHTFPGMHGARAAAWLSDAGMCRAVLPLLSSGLDVLLGAAGRQGRAGRGCGDTHGL